MEITAPGTEAADRLTELWLALAESQRPYGSHLLVDRNREAIRETILRHIVADSILVALDDDIVGFVMFSVESDRYVRDQTRGQIQNVYVRPDRRDEGIGSALLGAAHDRLEAEGVEVVTLEVMASNDAARRFYRRHGYNEHRVELEKPLDESAAE